MAQEDKIQLSAVIPAINEAKNISGLIDRIKAVMNRIHRSYEIVVVDGGSKDQTVEVARGEGARVVRQEGEGYGGALRSGFKEARGEYVVTMDADLSHEPEFFLRMWELKSHFEVVIASRYVSGASAEMSPFRYFLSRILNIVYAAFLSLGVRDLSSGFRMYQREALDSIDFKGENFDVLQEILLNLYCEGWRVGEVPFHYRVRRSGKTHVRLLKFAIAYLLTLFKMWRLRNSIQCADYEIRAFYSRIPLQRYWQRRRHKLILDFASSLNSICDVGCGSSKIIMDLPGAIGVDLNFRKLRYLRRTNSRLIQADLFRLPFRDASFDCVICSEVIEHIPRQGALEALKRILAPGGTLILGTPDYGKRTWRVIEKIYGWVHPGGYAHEHITHYTYASLQEALKNLGFEILDHAYICNSELIFKAKKIR